MIVGLRMATGRTRGLGTHTICATVVTGLEHGALEECAEVFGQDICTTSRGRGKIFFELASIESVKKVCFLNTVFSNGTKYLSSAAVKVTFGRQIQRLSG